MNNWTNIAPEYQNKVVAGLADQATVIQDVNPELAEAYRAAANELYLWVEGVSPSPIYAWMDSHKEEWAPHAGKVIAVHLEKGIVASDEPATFWNGDFFKGLPEEYQNNAVVFITTVPDDLYTVEIDFK